LDRTEPNFLKQSGQRRHRPEFDVPVIPQWAVVCAEFVEQRDRQIFQIAVVA